MVGWDFSRLDGRWSVDEPWWDFEHDCLEAMRATRKGILDLGTGGGERLSSLASSCHELPTPLPQVLATEGWAPNIAVARERLAPWSVPVLQYDADAADVLPIAERSVGLVMARHESYEAAEVARVLAPSGRFLTQQVDGHDAPEIHEWFGSDFGYPGVTVDACTDRLRDAGMRIDQVDEWSGQMRFADASALVTYLALVPWDAPDFSVEEHAQQLLALEAAAPIIVTQRRFRIYATLE
ncbi:class I SAM-dependent methyltransferase [Microbacterium esteraromaticum]|uniref:class I SAM-dependent methyltransferase n=1 Tax=Microbacterium esteraromaticum TaxID=57043 RepID=UPI001CD24B15|nr:methyltransferase domain-containing protein [Microbacterium esteraromaticum]MCA1306904.1 class I SAM-dependent methyltransferase [Microbacterium esteraromaticum]